MLERDTLTTLCCRNTHTISLCSTLCSVQAELIADVQEGRLDEARRAALHARWQDGQESREVDALLDALKRGFRRKRRAAAGLEDEEVRLAAGRQPRGRAVRHAVLCCVSRVRCACARHACL